MRRLFTILFTAITFVSLSFGQMVVKGDVVNVGNLRSDASVIVKTGAAGTNSNGKITNSGTLNLSNGITYTSTETDDGMLLNDYTTGSVNFLDGNNSYPKVRVAKTFKSEAGFYTAFSLPFDVKIADIRLASDATLTSLSELEYGKAYGIYFYDLQRRANSGSDGGNWGWAADLLKAGIAYEIDFDPSLVGGNSATLVFPAASKTTIDKIYSSDDINTDHKKIAEVVFHKNDNMSTQHWGWNFLGTNRTTNYSLYMDNIILDGQDSPSFIYAYTIADGEDTYDYHLVDIQDDEAILAPFAAYFIQIGETQRATANLYTRHSSLTHDDAQFRSSDINNKIELRLQGEGFTSSDRLLVKKADNYSNNYKLGEDAPKMFKKSAPAEFYTQVGEVEMAINKYQTIDSDLPIGLRIKEAGTYTISLTNLSGFDGEDIYIIDKDANKMQNLAQGDYVFTTSSTTVDNTDRLFLHFGSVTGIQTPTSKISVYVENNTAYVKNIKAGDQVSIYSTTGQVISRGVATSSEQSYPLAGTGVYVVKVTGSESYVSKVMNK